MFVEYDPERLLSTVDRFPLTKILVLGDIMLDEFIWGKVTRISPEAPVPVVDVVRETRLLGGAANVINNLVSAGSRAWLSGVVGADGAGREIVGMLEALGVPADGVMTVEDRPTTIKTRVVAHSQQVVRFDREKRLPVSPEGQAGLVAFLHEVADQVDGVIVSDYGKGVINEALMDEVRRVFVRPGQIVAVDPKVNNFRLYRGVTVITPNHHEAALGTGLTVTTEEDLMIVGRKIMTDLECGAVLITRGEQGMTLFERDGGCKHIPTAARKVFDVTGAGDTVISIFTLGLVAGLSMTEAAILANLAAGIVVGQVGTSAVTAAELKESITWSQRVRRL